MGRTRSRFAVLPAVAAALLTAVALVTGGGPAGAGTGAVTGPYAVSYHFLSSAVLAGTDLDGDPPGANIWTCRPSAAHPEPVVLVHGTFGNKDTNWRTYAPLLADNGYCVYSLTYGMIPGAGLPLSLLGGFESLESSAGQLRTFVDKVLASTGATKVDIVGHSQGTVVPDYYAKFLGGASKIDKYVSLAPLWHGTNVGGLSAESQLAAVFGRPPTDLIAPSLSEMGTGSPFMTKLQAGGVAVPGITYTNIVTRYDELVKPYTSGIEPGMTNIVVQNQCALDLTEHFEMAADPVASVDVLNALDPAHTRPVPCRLVLPFEG